MSAKELDKIVHDANWATREDLLKMYLALLAKQPKLLAVVEAAKAAKKGQYRGICADRLDEAIEALEEK